MTNDHFGSSLYPSGRARAGWAKPISSAVLDDLMSSSKTNSTTPEDKINCEVKKSAESSSSKPDVSALVFTPTQVKRKRIEINHREASPQVQKPDLNSSTESSGSANRNGEKSSSDSAYLTPDEPSSHRISVHTSTPNVLRPRLTAKRSLNSSYRRTDQSLSTSLNSSAYFSAEKSFSPSTNSTPVKRQKISWSNGSPWTDASICSDVSSSGEAGTGLEGGEAVEPELIGYQLVGDSQFCRFGQQLLGLRRVPMPNSPGRIGICVSGQTITDLHRRVKENFYPISDKIILMIGTNDFLRNASVGEMCSELKSLVSTLSERAVTIVLLTLPPIPKFANRMHSPHFEALHKYNSFIRSLDNGNSLRVADVSPLYSSPPPYQKCRMDLFELYFFGNKRHDLIHLNRKGLEVIRSYILEHFMHI